MPSVLIVDQDAVSMERIADCLTDLQIEFECADSGEEAIVKAHERDLYITEYVLPGMDGIRLTRLLRAASDAPILILSGQCDEALKVAAFYEGADEFIEKPISDNELKVRVMSALRIAGRKS